MLNHVVLMGRLTRGPEIKYTQSNLPVASFSLAVERDRSQQGEKKPVDFINIVAWRSTADFVGKYFVKGQLVAVSGRLQVREWTDQNGGKRYATEVVAESVYFAEPKREREQSLTPHPEQQYQQQTMYNTAPNGVLYSTVPSQASAQGQPVYQAC